MLWVVLLVALSPVLAFKGLTLTTLMAFFNVHPFWFLFILGIFLTRININYKKDE